MLRDQMESSVTRERWHTFNRLLTIMTTRRPTVSSGTSIHTGKCVPIIREQILKNIISLHTVPCFNVPMSTKVNPHG